MNGPVTTAGGLGTGDSGSVRGLDSPGAPPGGEPAQLGQVQEQVVELLPLGCRQAVCDSPAPWLARVGQTREQLVARGAAGVLTGTPAQMAERVAAWRTASATSPCR